MKNFVFLLTISRVISGPFIFFFTVFIEIYLVALFIFIFASLTDYYDGKLARSFNVETALGATLDPIADKILILFSMFAITLATHDSFIGLMSVFILSREFLVSALRELTASSNNNAATKVTFLAKIKTSIQFLALFLFFYGLGMNDALIIFIGKFFLFAALLISFKTALQYFQNTFFNDKGLK